MDKRVDTFRSGPFVFSLNHDRTKLGDSLIRAKVQFLTIREIPILPNLASNIEDDLIRKSIFGTAAIEGNPLSEEVVNRILTEEEKRGPLKRRNGKFKISNTRTRSYAKHPSRKLPSCWMRNS